MRYVFSEDAHEHCEADGGVLDIRRAVDVLEGIRKEVSSICCLEVSSIRKCGYGGNLRIGHGRANVIETES